MVDYTSIKAGKIVDAFIETKRLIAREMGYMPQHRNAEYLAKLNAHLEKLISMMDED